MIDVKKLKKDFMEWSGGFTPDEMGQDQIETYIELARQEGTAEEVEEAIDIWILDLTSAPMITVQVESNDTTTREIHPDDVQNLKRIPLDRRYRVFIVSSHETGTTSNPDCVLFPDDEDGWKDLFQVAEDKLNP